MWTAHTVLTQPSQQARLATLRRFGELCRVLRSLKDFSALSSINAGLSSGSVSRLKRLWDNVDAATKTQLEEVKTLCSSTRNYRNYRAEISTTQPPAVPFLYATHTATAMDEWLDGCLIWLCFSLCSGVWMQDITLIGEGNPRNINGYASLAVQLSAGWSPEDARWVTDGFYV